MGADEIDLEIGSTAILQNYYYMQHQTEMHTCIYARMDNYYIYNRNYTLTYKCYATEDDQLKKNLAHIGTTHAFNLRFCKVNTILRVMSVKSVMECDAILRGLHPSRSQDKLSSIGLAFICLSW